MWRRHGNACEMAAASLPALAAGDAGVARRAQVHVQTCLRCQAELAGYRRMLRTLHSMRSDHIAAHPSSLTAALKALESASADHSARALANGRRVAYVGGMVVATAAAGAAGAVVWSTRRRVGVLGRAVGT